jgi:acyl-CoA hydrolase
MLDIFQWSSWLSVMKYSAEILVANEFQDLNFTCPIQSGNIINFHEWFSDRVMTI